MAEYNYTQMIGDEWLPVEAGWQEVGGEGEGRRQDVQVTLTDVMLGDLGVSSAVYRDVKAGRKKVIGRR